MEGKNGGQLVRIDKGDPPTSPNVGRPKGSKSRSTIAKFWLEQLQKATNPLTGQLQELSQEDLITLAQLKEARKGKTQAYLALLDSAYGKVRQSEDEPEGNGVITPKVPKRDDK